MKKILLIIFTILFSLNMVHSSSLVSDRFNLYFNKVSPLSNGVVLL